MGDKISYNDSPFKWIPISDIKLYKHCKYWIAYGSDKHLDVTKAIYIDNGFEYPSTQPSFCSHPHIVQLNEVKYVIEDFEPDAPDTGKWSGTTNIQGLGVNDINSETDTVLQKALDYLHKNITASVVYTDHYDYSRGVEGAEVDYFPETTQELLDKMNSKSSN